MHHSQRENNDWIYKHWCCLYWKFITFTLPFSWSESNTLKSTAIILSISGKSASSFTNICKLFKNNFTNIHNATQLALRRWPNVGIGRHRRDRQPTSRQRWYSVACVATVCWHSVGARRLAYRSLPMFCVWTSVVGIKCFSKKCCRSTRLSIHQLHI